MSEQIKVEFDDDPIGASIMEAITSGLYADNLNCIREYVQNAIDADAKSIRINHCNGGKDIEIEDDGNGMDLHRLVDSLRVGHSEKKEGDVGWRGIGIWSGAAVCERIQIVTQTADGDRLSVSVRCGILTETDRPSGDRTSAAKILKESLSGIDKERNDGTGHFTKVTLSGIYSSLLKAFSADRLSGFLERTVPMRFSDDFAPGVSINERLEAEGVRPACASIYVGGRELRKRPVDPADIFPEPSFVEICHDGRKLAIAWFVGTNKNEKLKGGEITFRKSNFRVGDTSLVYKSAAHAYRGWQHGEIHILDRGILENASRDGFNASIAETNLLYESLGELLSGLELLSQYTSAKLHTRALKDVAKEEGGDGRIKIAKEELGKVRKPTHVVPDCLSAIKRQVDCSSAEQVDSLDRIASGGSASSPPSGKSSVGPSPSRAFETLSWKGLDNMDAAENALICLLKELRDVSSSRHYGKYPIATGMLVRSAYEWSLKLLAEANGLNNAGRDKLSAWEESFGKWMESNSIAVNEEYKNSRLYKSFLSIKENGYRDRLNSTTHNPDIVRLTKESIENMASEGMCAFLQSAAEAIGYAKDHRKGDGKDH